MKIEKIHKNCQMFMGGKLVASGLTVTMPVSAFDTLDHFEPKKNRQKMRL